MPDAIDLSERRILVVEDDFYLASDTERALRAAGARVVGPVPRSAPALDALAQDGVDAAILDINLGDGPTFELADALKAAGVPFMFVTGYDQAQIPPRHADARVVLKPSDMHTVAEVLSRLLASAPDPQRA